MFSKPGRGRKYPVALEAHTPLLLLGRNQTAVSFVGSTGGENLGPLFHTCSDPIPHLTASSLQTAKGDATEPVRSAEVASES